MTKLPESVCKAREIANVKSTELYDAWERINEIECPTMEDIEQWLEVKNSFEIAQNKFEEKLFQFLNSRLN